MGHLLGGTQAHPGYRLQGGACYEEVHELWQRVTEAEQAASEAAAELHTDKDAARHAILALKVGPEVCILHC